jgi:CHAT domain-containing protein
VLGLQQRTPEADGYVTAAEWPAYDLRSELAVLSACDSGVGKVVSGEGVMGLPFAMFVAGNVNTLLSLWPVDDRATAEFVTAFFEPLKAGPRRSAGAGRHQARVRAPPPLEPPGLLGAVRAGRRGLTA